MGGGPSQLETFDPKPGTNIAAGTTAIDTAAKGVQLASGLEQLADQMKHIALVRSLESKEGDHERGTYTLKTGYRPDPTVTHPSLGAIVCHDLPGAGVEIPRHVSILPNEWPARGGLLGAEYDAFKMYDPADKVPDVAPHVANDRFEQRLEDLKVVDEAFAKDRGKRVEATGHKDTMERARRMMSSDQLKAFDVSREPASLRKEYGDSPFGRGCLAARRLLEVGVRCVEVTLSGWDSHANNHQITTRLKGELDPAFAALIRDLAKRGHAQGHGDPVRRRVRPNAATEPASGPRSLAAQLQRRAGRRRHPRRHGRGRERSVWREGSEGQAADSKPSRNRSESARHRLGKEPPRPIGKNGAAERGEAD